VDEHLRNGQSFALETTLSGKNYLQRMLTARKMGFDIALVYVGTSDVEINLVRVARRVIGGGHNVPEADIRRRYERSLKNLVTAVHRADFSIVFDNSTERGYRKIVLIEHGECTWFDPVPAWAAPLKASFDKK
jgi:predicted ABC-type ATPase